MKRVCLLSCLTLLMTACIGPYQQEIIEEIQPNETAFLVPLEGATQEGQARFQSVAYLDEIKVATKRVTVPTRKRNLGRMWNNYEWIPTAKLIKVDRTPQTRAWTSSSATGTSNADQAINVESADSVGFSIGVTCTAAVEEPDAAKFLYNYSGKTLAEIMDNDVRNYIQSYASLEFGKLQLNECQLKKGEIFTQCAAKATTFFKEFGITIRNLGYSEGMLYENKQIQEQIDQAFTSELQKKLAEQARQAQTVKNLTELEVASNTLRIQQIKNQQELAIAENKRKQAEEFQKAAEAQRAMVELEIMKLRADAMNTFAKNWKGGVPAWLTMDGKQAPMLLNMPAPPQTVEALPTLP